MRYQLYGIDPNGKEVTFESEEYVNKAAREAHFAALRKQGIDLRGAKPLDTQQQPTTTPSSITTSATPSAGPQFIAGPGEKEVATNRRSMLGTLGSAVGAAAASALAPQLVPLKVASAFKSAGPVIRTLAPLAGKMIAAGVGGGTGGAIDEAVQGGNAQEVSQRALDDAFLSALTQGGFSLVGGVLKGAGTLFKKFVGVELSPAQRQAIQTAYQQAQAEGRPFSITGYVQQAPEFAGTPARQRIQRMAELGGRAHQERAGVPQVRWAQQQAEQALKAGGGELAPQAQGVSPGFGEDMRELLTTARTRLQQEAQEAAALTVKKPSARLGGPSERKVVQSVLGDLKAPRAEAQARLAGARQLPDLRAQAKERAEQLYQKRLEQETRRLYGARVKEIRDRTGINVDTVTQEQLAVKLRGSKADEVSALVNDFPELGPTIGRAKLTDAIATAGANPASDSFDPAAFAKSIRDVGEHNFERVFGSNAEPMKKLLANFDQLVEGTALARNRAQGLTTGSAPWQPVAAVLGPIFRAAGGAGAGAMLAGPGGGAAGALFGASTAIKSETPQFYAAILSNPRSLDWITRVVGAAADGTLDKTSAPAFLADFTKNILPQLAVRTSDLMGSQTAPPPGTESMQPADARY